MPAVLLQTAILSLMMALVGLLCALLLKDFRQFTKIYPAGRFSVDMLSLSRLTPPSRFPGEMQAAPLGTAAVLFKEKGMGVICVHAILPVQKDLFLLSKLAVFLLIGQRNVCPKVGIFQAHIDVIERMIANPVKFHRCIGG